jgi:DNA repair protein RadA/Sms
MPKVKTIYVCQSCGGTAPKWAGQCADCSEWNTLVESVNQPAANTRYKGFADAADTTIKTLADIPAEHIMRHTTQLTELDRVLGGGLVTGSVVLIGGDPGIGKSTLLLQTTCLISQKMNVLYVTGEESLQQVSLRSKRLGLNADALKLLAETQVERVLALAKQAKPDVVVVDSIQTMYCGDVSSAPGSVSQVRESAAQLVRYAKQTNTALFLVGHVTKEGALAGPRVLEHMVDTVLYFEGQSDSRYRVIRAVKNRFGAVNELGVFAMTDQGLKQVENPSAIFLSGQEHLKPGSVVMASWEGSRPLLVEVQALVDSTHSPNPRRVCVGLEQNRLAMLLAVLSRHGGVPMYDQDVFVNIVGGMRITETGIDLAALMAIASSLKDKPIDSRTVVFGEVGLSGEIRPVQSGQERIREAAKQGFTTMVVPKLNAPQKSPAGVTIHAVDNLQAALGFI